MTELTASATLRDLRDRLPISIGEGDDLQGLFDSLETKIAALEDNISTGGNPGSLGVVLKTLAKRVDELWTWYDHSLRRVADTELDNQRHRKDGVLSDLARCREEMRETRPGELPSVRKLERWASTLDVVASRLGDIL